MIRQLADSKILFKTKHTDITTKFYIERNNGNEIDITVPMWGNLDGCKAIYQDKEYDVKFIKHIQIVGIGVDQIYKYVLTRSE